MGGGDRSGIFVNPEGQVGIERPRKSSLEGDESRDFSLNEMSNRCSNFRLF
jgi:hypothetical protein